MENSVRQRRHNRIRAKVKGTAERPRACVFRSNKRVSVQVIDDVSGKTLLSVYGQIGDKQTKQEQAVAVGKQVADLAKGAGITKIVFDRGGYAYQGRIEAVAAAMRQGGLLF
ncbi:MAG: 50S ribosomal protein L18 [Candidatus Andersenbacteria bacterium]|nr:50S ribosomal protein L18 [Candidatus Andersenbacteria bacterium]